TGKSQKAHCFRREEMSQRDVSRRFGATEQMRKTLFSVEASQTVGQINPIPGLFDLVFGQAALKLAFEDASRIVRTDFRQSPHLDHVMRSRPQTGLHGFHLAALKQYPEAILGRFHGRLVELAALEKVDMLARHRGQVIVKVLTAMQMPA